jgi:hypothetical protein
MHGLLIAHAAATWFMTGVIWTAQVVLYPLFPRVGPERFSGYARAHARRILPLAGAGMLLEMTAALGLLVRPAAGVPPRQAAAGLALLVLIWTCTAAVQLPQHARLRRGFDESLARALVRWNWIRTVLWSARAGLAAVWLARPPA